MRKIAFLAALPISLMLNGCGSTPAQQQTLAAAGSTLAAIAAQNNTTVASLVSKGALFCQLNGGTDVIGVLTAAGAPASVTNQSAPAVANTCAALNAIPVPAPANPGSVPVQTAPSTSQALPPVATS